MTDTFDQPNDFFLNYVPGKCHCGCGNETARLAVRFRQGHDAKLKSMLIITELEGGSVIADNGMGPKAFEPVAYARLYGFADQVLKGVDRRRNQSVRRGERRIKTQGGSPDPIRAKIGRWEYDGFVLKNGEFTYVDKKGVTQTTTNWKAVL